MVQIRHCCKPCWGCLRILSLLLTQRFFEDNLAEHAAEKGHLTTQSKDLGRELTLTQEGTCLHP